MDLPSKCYACHQPLGALFALAMLTDLGAQGSDPLYCPKTADHKHDFVPPENKPTRAGEDK